MTMVSADIITYRVTQGAALFHELNTLLIALQGVAVASELVMSGQVLHSPGDY